MRGALDTQPHFPHCGFTASNAQCPGCCWKEAPPSPNRWMAALLGLLSAVASARRHERISTAAALEGSKPVSRNEAAALVLPQAGSTWLLCQPSHSILMPHTALVTSQSLEWRCHLGSPVLYASCMPQQHQTLPGEKPPACLLIRERPINENKNQFFINEVCWVSSSFVPLLPVPPFYNQTCQFTLH